MAVGLDEPTLGLSGRLRRSATDLHCFSPGNRRVDADAGAGTGSCRAGRSPAGKGTVDTKSDLEKVISKLVEIRKTNGTISAVDYDEALVELGKEPTAGARGHLRRRVNAVCPAALPASRSFEVDQDTFIALAASRSIEAFHRDVVQDQHPNLSLPSLYRALHKQIEPALLAYIKPGQGGMEKFRARAFSCLWHCEHFGEAWQTDVTDLGFTAVPPGRGYKNPVKVKLIAVIDDATRLIVGWGLVYCDGRSVNARDVAGVLIGAMNRYGVPQQIVTDNGKEYDNQVIAELLVRAGTACRLTPRYRGESKGKIERWNRSTQNWLSKEYASWTGGAASSARYSIMGGNNRKAPRHKAVHDKFSEWIEEYNAKRVHSALGMTPQQAYEADPAELPPLELHEVLRFAPVHNAGREDEFRVVKKEGVQFNNHAYHNLDPASPGRAGLSGKQCLNRMIGNRRGVRIRPVNGDPTVVGVYDARDRFVCIATRMDQIPTELKFLSRSDYNADLRTAELAARDAQELIEARYDDITTNDDDTPTATTTVPIETFVAERLDTPCHMVQSHWDKMHIDGEADPALVQTILVDNPNATFDHDTLIEIFLGWADRVDEDRYRIENTLFAATYHRQRSLIELADKTTGEIERLKLTIATVTRDDN